MVLTRRLLSFIFLPSNAFEPFLSATCVTTSFGRSLAPVTSYSFSILFLNKAYKLSEKRFSYLSKLFVDYLLLDFDTIIKKQFIRGVLTSYYANVQIIIKGLLSFNVDK